jgi:hypothetical protein
MKYNISIQKILKPLLMFILTLLITTSCINISNTSRVYAGSSGNGNQGDGGTHTNTRSGGINTLQQGFLLYVADIDSGDTMTPGHTYSIKSPTVQMR